MQLRPYQAAAIQSLFDWWGAGRQGEWPCINLPTGAGKTVVFSALLQRLFAEYPGVSALILAHRKELIEQAEEKLLRVWPAAPVGVYAAALDRREGWAPILIASRDTIARRLDDIGQRTFVIVDEAHTINQKEEGRYRAILAELKARYPDLVVIGFTATPFRLGQGRIYGKGKLFSDCAFKLGMADLIDQKHLAPLTARTGDQGEIDTDGVATTAGDFNEKQLAERACVDVLVDAALADWKEKALDAGRHASVFFCVSKLHATLVSEKLHALGIDCPAVFGDTPAGERAALLAGFARGDFPAIANVGILTEGWDCPRTDCIVLLRPTQSVALYVQMVGRGLRLSPATGKHDCLVLDYGGNIARLGPVDCADISEPGAGKKREKLPPCNVCTRDLCKTCGEWVPAHDTEPGHWRDGCGHHNATGAKQCEACGQPFLSHDTRAANGGIVSSEIVRRIEVFQVEEITCRVATSREGRDYLRVAYRVSLFETFYRNLMLGYPGYAGQKAAQQWLEMTGQGGVTTPGEACERADFLPVIEIHVDMNSKWKDIVHVDYAEELRHAA